MIARPNQPSAPAGLPVQQAGFATEASQMAPMLAHRLANVLEQAGQDARSIFKQTGWFRDTDGTWNFEYGDQPFRLNTESRSGKLLTDPGQISPAQERRTQFSPPMKDDPNSIVAPGWYRSQDGGLHFAGSAPEKEPLLKLREQAHPDQLDFMEARMPKDLWGDTPGNPFVNAMTTNQALPSVGDFRAPTAAELFHHPMMFDVAPELRNDIVLANRDPSTYRGWYSGVGGSGMATGGMPGDLGNKSMESVALHEFSGHGSQKLFDRPRGGNSSEQGMYELGGMIQQKARDYSKAFYEAKMNEFNRRTAAGENPTTVWNEIQMRGSPRQPFQMDKWTSDPGPAGVSSGLNPDYRGYQGLHGEAMARNVERRAQLPVTKYKLDPRVGRGSYMTRGGEKVSDPRYGQPGGTGSTSAMAQVQGDVHPFETLDIPPDLMFMVPQTPRIGPPSPADTVLPGGLVGRFPQSQGQFDWLFRRG